MTSNTIRILQRTAAPGTPRSVTHRRAVTASSIADLNTWYEKHSHGSTLAVGGRYGTRNGRMVCLGGLSWSLHIVAIEGGPVTVSLDTAEDAALPDLPIVRACFPSGSYRNSRRPVAA